MPRSRAARLACYAIPFAFCLAVHWLALKTWFFSDDFAWLGLRSDIGSPHDLLLALFEPRAQGTVRTLSERLFFLVFSSLFGLSAPPFRIWVFLTQFANIALLIVITRRLTGSALASILAPVFWCGNAALALAMAWSSAYNEIACAFFILLAFYFLLRHIETGQSKYWIWQWVAFILGFGALELNVVYPALAAAYTLLCARAYFRKTLWLFLPSTLFAYIHLFVIPAPTDPYYSPHYDAGIFMTLWKYLIFAAGASRPNAIDWRPVWLGLACAALALLALAAFALRRSLARDGRAIFLAAWFFIVIAPVLPLRNHFTEYYVTIPSIGFSILAAWGFAASHVRARIGLAALAALYLTLSITDIYVSENYYYSHSRKIKHLIASLEALPQEDRSKIILLAGIDNDFFWSGFFDNPFRLIGVDRLYLVPGSETSIAPHPEWGGISRYVIPIDVALQDIRKHEAAVYALDGRTLRDVTWLYEPVLAAQYALRPTYFVDVADPIYKSRLGPEWYRIENGGRWMPKVATLRLGGPPSNGHSLSVSGYCAAVLLAHGPLEVTFSADGLPLGSAKLTQPKIFALKFPLPPQLTTRREIEIKIEVNRTFVAPGDPRPLGLVFGTFSDE
jgi:hypothetical protein